MKHCLAIFALAATLHAQVPAVSGPPVEAFSLRYVDLKTGDGALAAAGQRYRVHYTGWLRDGTKFDSSLDRNEPIEFVQGRRQVIAGWETGFEGMRVGGRRRLIIPWQLAYGEAGSGPIPPKAELIFDVELLAAEDVAPLAPGVDVLLPLEQLESQLTALTKAFPEEKYDWRPGRGARSVREVVLHIAAGLDLMMDIATKGLSGDELNRRIQANAKAEAAAIASRDELLNRLESSFAAARKYLQTARAGTLGREMQFFGRETTRRGVFVFIDTHIAEHLGQLIAYARMNGIVPPWTRA